jgi:hypothetical protein
MFRNTLWFTLLNPGNRAVLPHTLTRGLYVGHCLQKLFSLPAPTATTSFRGTQAIFRTKPFHVQNPTFSTAVTLHTYSPLKMEQTECSETLAFKLQAPGNNPEGSLRHSKHGESLKSRITRNRFQQICLTLKIFYLCGATAQVEPRSPHF